jgi:hypothetical protein
MMKEDFRRDYSLRKCVWLVRCEEVDSTTEKEEVRERKRPVRNNKLSSVKAIRR